MQSEEILEMRKPYINLSAVLVFKGSLETVYLVDEQNGSEQRLHHNQVLRSKLILDVAEFGPDACTPLPISVDLMKAWLAYTEPGKRTVNSCERLAKLLQACFCLHCSSCLGLQKCVE